MSRRKPGRNLATTNNNQGIETHETSIGVSFRQGPLPSPQELAQYNDIIPNGAERIMRMAEKQQEHRMGLEKSVIRSDIRQSFLGLAAGFIVALSSLGGGVTIALSGQPIAGTAFGGLTLAGLVSVFVTGNLSRKKERENKAKPDK